MKLAMSILLLSLTVFLTTVSAGSLNTANNFPATNIAANTKASIEAAGMPLSGSAEAPAVTPAAVVADLYKQHNANKSPFFQAKNRALVDKYFTKPLADRIWKDATTEKNEVGVIDGDALYDAQDTKIKNFAIGKSEIKGDAVTCRQHDAAQSCADKAAVLYVGCK